MYYTGINYHKRYSVVSIQDETVFFTEGTSRYSLLNVGCYPFFYKTSAV